jgi:carboxyl-terminal processing protease
MPAAGGAVKVEAAEVPVRGGAAVDAPVVALAKHGAVLPVSSVSGPFKRVEWAPGRFGFVPTADVVAARGERSGQVTEAWQKEQPRIVLSPDPAKGAPVTEGETFKLSGTVSLPPSVDPDARLRDVYVFVNDEKIFFRVAPDGAAGGKLEFTTDVPLKAGANAITVVAREDQEFMSRRGLVVWRKAPPAVAETTSGPKAKGTP